MLLSFICLKVLLLILQSKLVLVIDLNRKSRYYNRNRGENFMPVENVYIGRQPILNPDLEITGYELLFRSGLETSANVKDHLFATARVLVNTLNNIGIPRLIGNKTGFININDELLKKGIFESLPGERFILEFLESTKIDDYLLQLVDNMKSQGYRFALDDFVVNEDRIAYLEPLIKRVCIIKMDIKQNHPDKIKDKIRYFKNQNIELLAEKIENMSEFQLYKKIGFDLFQGYFFERPTIIKTQNTDPHKTAIINLIGLIHENQDINRIEKAFKQYPDLTINLLRFINSAAIFVRSKITSVKQAIALLGYHKLMNWLILLAYAIPGKSHSSNPLFQTASIRGKAMELLIRKKHSSDITEKSDSAFLVGLLSLMDALFLSPMEDILKGLNVSKEIQDSIIFHHGEMGRFLYLIRLIEEYDLETAKSIVEELGLSIIEIRDIMLESYSWAEEIKDTASGE